MASPKALLIAAAAMAIVMGALLPATAWMHEYVVGGNRGRWTTGVNYTDWLRELTDGKYIIPVNVILHFKYTEGEHTVVRVDEDGYTNCDVDNNIDMWDTGDDRVLLHEVDKYFFICGTGDRNDENGNHCDQGMKFAITTEDTNE